MKQNIILIIILVALFFFGLLIYDFSDSLDSSIANNEWYAVQDGNITVISFADYKFNYYDYDTEVRLNEYKDCLDYRFNRSINVIRLNCPIRSNKIYVTKIEEDELILKIDGEDITFYSSSEAALNAEFIKNNEITNEEFSNLMNFNVNNFKIITLTELNELLRVKNNQAYVAFVNSEETIINALNMAALASFNTSVDELSVVIVEDLPISGTVLDINLAEFNRNQIPIYLVGNRNFELSLSIEIDNYSDINKYSNRTINES